MNTIGIDIGGTKINFVLLRNSKVFKTREMATPKTRAKLIEAIKENVKKIISPLSETEIAGIGLGVPGPLNPQGDLILAAPNLKYLSGTRLAKIIQKDLKIKTKMENDVNCFTLGETLIGAGRGAKIVFGITLGTGVGGGIVMDGKIYRGSSGAAGEVGHMIVNFNGPKCSCGNYGCFEEYASERFILKKAGVSPKELGNRTVNKNKQALKIFKEYGKYLGIGLASVVNLLDPEIIIIGGGISKRYPFFIKEAEKAMRQRIISPVSRKYVKIKKANLGNFAGAIGASLSTNITHHA